MSEIDQTGSGVDQQPALVRLVSQADIDAYADLSGDHNPLHVDPVFAANGRFGRTVAHGQLLVAILFRALAQRWGMARSSRLTLDVKFVAPVYAGDTVAVYLREAAAPSTGEASRCQATITAGDRVAVVATVVMKGGPDA